MREDSTREKSAHERREGKRGERKRGEQIEIREHMRENHVNRSSPWPKTEHMRSLAISHRRRVPALHPTEPPVSFRLQLSDKTHTIVRGRRSQYIANKHKRLHWFATSNPRFRV